MAHLTDCPVALVSGMNHCGLIADISNAEGSEANSWSAPRPTPLSVFPSQKIQLCPTSCSGQKKLELSLSAFFLSYLTPNF